MNPEHLKLYLKGCRAALILMLDMNDSRAFEGRFK